MPAELTCHEVLGEMISGTCTFNVQPHTVAANLLGILHLGVSQVSRPITLAATICCLLHSHVAQSKVPAQFDGLDLDEDCLGGSVSPQIAGLSRFNV